MTERTELPIPDYDHLPEGSLQSRIRSLSADQLHDLLDYEQTHGDRLPVLELMRRRLEALEAGADPSAGDPAAAQPEQAPAPQGGSSVSEASAQANNQPLRHGVAGQTPDRDIRGR
jgi:hypothetical protein